MNTKKWTQIWTLLYIGHVAMAADLTYMRRTFVDHLSSIRHHVVNPCSKDAAREHIYDEFRRFGLETEYNSFTYQFENEPQETFSNVVGVLKGTHFGSAADSFIIVGAHFDTVGTSSGVDDNGSGVTALLEVARQLTNRAGVTRKNTVIFVTFDLEEYGLIGSEMFIQTWIGPWLVRNYGSNAMYLVPHGAIILDTVMLYNASEGSQVIPDNDELKALFHDALESVQSDGYRGDFVTLIYRKPTRDNALAKMFRQYWKTSGRPRFELEELPIPFADPSDLDSMPEGMGRLLRSDHVNFWKNDISSLYLTDTGDIRGPMTTCYHQLCDNLEVMLTADNLRFLGKTADVTAAVVNDLSQPSYKDWSWLLDWLLSIFGRGA